MEALGFAILIGLVGLFLVLPIWVVVAIKGLQRRAEKDERLHAQRWADLTSRVHVLENQVKELREAPGQRVAEPAAQEGRPTEAESRQEAAASQKVAPVAEGSADAAALTPASEVTPPPISPRSSPAASIPAIRPAAVKSSPTPLSSATPVTPVSPPSAPPAQVSPPALRPQGPSFASVEPSQPEARSGMDLEMILGTRWLIKIGIAIVVLGLAFFLREWYATWGPGTKVAFGLLLSAGMIGVGVRFERNERYRILARAIAAGGWSLLYFLSYAVYHLDATRIIQSRELDFLLMLAVGAAIVGYSLRYRSQATTALALGLSYLTVGIHHTSVYSLTASVVLSLAVVAIALRMRWFKLEILAIIATYLNHFIWLAPIIDRMGESRVEFPEFRTSAGLLGFYWLLFRFSYIWRRPADAEEEKLSTAAALLNGVCLLGMLKYQSVHPEWTFWALLTLGFAELGLAAWAATRRRTAFVVLATLGSALLVAAVPFRYAGTDLAWLWLIGGEAFFLAGVFTNEIVFRRVGGATLYLVAGYMIFVTGPALVEQLVESSLAGPFYATAWLFAAGAAICYANSHWVRGQWPDLFQHEFDAGALAAMTFVGGAQALLAVWFFFPGLWTAVAWAALALALNVVSKRLGKGTLALQGNLISGAAIVRLATMNFTAVEHWDGLSLRLITVGATAVLLYVGAAFAGVPEPDAKPEEKSWVSLSAGYTWAATILLYVLAWYELDARYVAPVWMVGALALVEIGLRKKRVSLGWQAYAAMIASFVRIFLVNLQEAGTGAGISPRVVTVLPIAAAYFYADWRLRRTEAWPGFEAFKKAGIVLSSLGTAAVVALLYFEMNPSWLAAGWAGVALALMALAWGLRRTDFLFQSFAMAALVAIRGGYWIFVTAEPDGLPFAQSRSFYVGTAIALLFAALPFAFAWRQWAKQSDGIPLGAEQVFFFVPFGLLTALVAVEATTKHLTVAWGIEGVAVFLFAVLAGERSFRLSGLILLLVCVVKVFALDVWGLDPQSRYITMIALGVALVLVSFLYTRYKEKFRPYL